MSSFICYPSQWQGEAEIIQIKRAFGLFYIKNWSERKKFPPNLAACFSKFMDNLKS